MPKIRHEINMSGQAYSNTSNAQCLEMVYVDPTKYNGTLTWYLEAVGNVASGNTGTISLCDSSWNVIQSLTFTETDVTIKRVLISSPPSAASLLRLKSDLMAYHGEVRIVIIQDTGEDPLTNSETQIDIGGYFSTKSNGDQANAAIPKYWTYNSGSWDGTVSIYFEAVVKTPSSAHNGYFALQQDDGNFANWTLVGQSRLSVKSADYARFRSSAITSFTDGRHYRFVAASGTYGLNTSAILAKIIIVQSSETEITKLEENYHLNTFGDGGIVGDAKKRVLWVPGDWYGTGNTFKYSQDASNVADSAKLVNITDSQDIVTLTGINTKLSSALPMPGEDKVLGLTVLNSTGNVSSGKIIAALRKAEVNTINADTARQTALYGLAESDTKRRTKIDFQIDADTSRIIGSRDTIDIDTKRGVIVGADVLVDTKRSTRVGVDILADTVRRVIVPVVITAEADTKREVITRYYADKSPLTVHFFPTGLRISPHTLEPGKYKKGTANLTPNSSQLVNKLWVKGGKTTSDLYSQPITVGTEPIALFYSPRAPVTVTIGGVEKTLGIQNITEVGTCDFLLNAAEKLLIPDLCTTGTGTISYKYEYPIKILLEEPNSQEQYGTFEDILKVDTDDKDLALELGYRHLLKYSQPVVSGSIEPFAGIYRPGDYVLTTIPDLNINQYLEVKQVTYDSIPGTRRVDIKLQLESPERDLSNILKDLSKRLAALEKATLNDDEGPVEFYISREESLTWTEVAEKVSAIETEDTLTWAETAEKTTPISHEESIAWTESFVELATKEVADETTGWTEDLTVTQASLLPSGTLYPAEDLYPM